MGNNMQNSKTADVSVDPGGYETHISSGFSIETCSLSQPLVIFFISHSDHLTNYLGTEFLQDHASFSYFIYLEIIGPLRR